MAFEPKLKWDQAGERYYETGDRRAVLYPFDASTKTYPKGVAWSGLTAFTLSPSGAEASAIYADDIKYAELRSAEEVGATIEAYTYPDEWAACDGSAELAKGVYIGQQARQKFGFAVRTGIGSDASSDAGYKLHLLYGGTASPSEKSYQTVNDSPEAITFSWEITTNPVDVPGFKPTSCITIDSRHVDATKLENLEKILYGFDSTEARLPLPDEVITIFGGKTTTPANPSTGGTGGTGTGN